MPFTFLDRNCNFIRDTHTDAPFMAGHRDDFRLSHAHDAISGRIARYFYNDFGSLAEAEYGDGATPT